MDPLRSVKSLAANWITGIILPAGARILFFSTALKAAPGPTECPSEWLPGALSPRVKRPEREGVQSPSNVKVKKAWNFTSTAPLLVFMQKKAPGLFLGTELGYYD
jgi:hypothetical protein